MASSGTFTAQDQTSDIVKTDKFIFGLAFVGSGTVVLEADLTNNNVWQTIETYTATQTPVVYDGVTVPTRLKCTVYSADIDYRIA